MLIYTSSITGRCTEKYEVYIGFISNLILSYGMPQQIVQCALNFQASAENSYLENCDENLLCMKQTDAQRNRKLISDLTKNVSHRMACLREDCVKISSIYAE
jgi:hypothetical protein